MPEKAAPAPLLYAFYALCHHRVARPVEVTHFLSPDLHSLVVVLRAHATGGTLAPGDDAVEVGWFPLAGPLPELAFAADEHIIARYARTRLPGAPVDPR